MYTKDNRISRLILQAARRQCLRWGREANGISQRYPMRSNLQETLCPAAQRSLSIAGHETIGVKAQFLNHSRAELRAVLVRWSRGEFLDEF